VDSAAGTTQALTINSTGVTTLNNKVGYVDALASLSTNVGGSLVMNAGSITTTGNQSYGEATTLAQATTLNAGAGNVTFSSTVDSTSGTHQALTVNSTGVTTFNNKVGFVDALASVTTSVGGSLVMNAGSVTTTGNQTYGQATMLTQATTLNAGAGNVTFNNTLDGGFDLVINATGSTRLDGDVGASTPLASLTTNAGGMVLVDASTVHTTGTQTYNDMVSLLRNVTLTGSGVTFNAAVMGTGDLAVVGAAVLNGGSITTTGAQTYNGNMALQKNTLLDAGAGAVTFNGMVDGAYTLTVNSGGVTTFNGPIGSTSALSSLSTDANTSGSLVMNGGSVVTTGAQSYGEAVSLTANTTLTSSGAGDISFGQVLNGAQALWVNTAGATRFMGVVGNITPLASVTTDTGGTVLLNGGSVTTSGAQTYRDAMTLGAHSTLTSTTDTVNFLRITDGVAGFDLKIETAIALVLGDVDSARTLQVITHAGGVSQQPNTSINLAGTSTFTADTGTLQVAALTGAGNTFGQLLTLTQAHGGSWANVSITTDSPLSLGPLESAGSVNLQTQGGLTTSTLSTTGALTINSHGGAVALGQTSVSGNLTLDTNGGNVSQMGPLTIAGDTAISTVSTTPGAPSGTISLDYVSYDNATPPNLISNTFAGTLALSGNSTAVATSGNLRLANVSNTGPMTLRAPTGSIDLGTAFITGGDLTLVSRDDMNLGGASISGSLNMSSTQGTVSFGSATVSHDLIASTNNQAIDLGTANIGGNLSVQSHGGDIVQSTAVGSSLQVTGTSNLDAGTGNVTLSNTPNLFVGAISMQAHNVDLAGTHGLILGNSTVTGVLNVTAATGNITQIAPLTVAGITQITATQGDVVLGEANSFAQTLGLNAVNATVHSTSALTLASSTLTGNLDVKVDTGDVTQTGPLYVTGTSSVDAQAGKITLTDAGNSFGDRVSIHTPQALALTASGALRMGEVNVGLTTNLQSHGVLDMGTASVYTGKLKVNSGGFDIIQSGPLKAGADEDFDAGGAKIDLFNPKNLWLGALYFKGGVIMINHPQLMNAVNSGVLMERAEVTVERAALANVTITPPMQNTSVASSGNAVSVIVNRTPSGSQVGVIQVHVASEMAAPGKSFSFALDPNAVAGHAADVPLKMSQMDGKPLPNWLRYDASSKTFIASEVPAGAFPLQIKVSVGNTESVMLIREKPPGK
jgi:Repeats of unknown function (DUF5649)